MVRANDKLSVLSAEAPINQPMLTDGSAFFQLQEEMRNAFETTVLDLPRQMLVQHPHLVHDAHVCIVVVRSEEHTSELQSLMRISYAVFCLKKKNQTCTYKQI